VKGQSNTIGEILADFVASCSGKIGGIHTQILHFLKKELSRCADEMSYYLRNQ
jgi:hypothetical protein